MTKDLTRGTPWKLIVQFALPIMAGFLDLAGSGNVNQTGQARALQSTHSCHVQVPLVQTQR